MKTDLSNYRKSYEKQELLEDNVGDNPFALFEKWFHEVDHHFEVGEPNAMTLNTVGIDGYPKSRVVLLKSFSAEGFVFYTNYESEKGKAIAANPNVCLSFFWPEAERQVIIKGKAQKVKAEESDQYFHSRPKGSQLGALASQQSEVIESREVLEKKLMALEKDYDSKEVPRPDFWGGFIVAPIEVEFWQGRPNRLHDRLRFLKQSNLDWKIDRLSP